MRCIVILSLIALTVAKNVPLGPGEECSENSKSWAWDCNTCTCDNGVTTCTQKACPPKAPVEEWIPMGPGKKCDKEGETVPWDCNLCTCTEGLMACTLDDCSLSARAKRHTACTPETVWTKNCQKCKCSNIGESHCDPLPNCIPTDVPEKTSCQPGEEWMQDCNKCVCNAEGKGSCTRQLCESDAHMEVAFPGERKKRDTSEQAQTGPGQPCTNEGQSWPWDCNTCFCSNGLSACTQMACVSKREVGQTQMGPGEACTNEGQSWPWECNTCHCTGGISSCTQKACRSKREVAPTQMGPGEACTNEGQSWPWECNTCHCSGGISSCTQKACRSKRGVEQTQLGPGKPCTNEGQSWPWECNTCHCNGGFSSCTRKACISKREVVLDQACTPETVWTKSCQKCKCDVSGKSAHCETVPDCVPTEIIHKTTCEPNEVWKEDCNNCHCTDDKKPACTKKLCESSPHFEGPLPPSADRRKRDAPSEKIEKSGVDCLVGQNFWGEGCEWCTCYEGGNASCSIDQDCLKKEAEKASIKQEVQKEQIERQKRSPVLLMECKPGDTYKDDCNTCTCVANGPPFCTLKQCAPQVQTFTYPAHTPGA